MNLECFSFKFSPYAQRREEYEEYGNEEEEEEYEEENNAAGDTSEEEEEAEEESRDGQDALGEAINATIIGDIYFKIIKHFIFASSHVSLSARNPDGSGSGDVHIHLRTLLDKDSILFLWENLPWDELLAANRCCPHKFRFFISKL